MGFFVVCWMDQNLNIYFSGNYFLTLVDGYRKIYFSSQGYAVHLPNWTVFQGDLLVTETEAFQKSTWVIFFKGDTDAGDKGPTESAQGDIN